MTTANHIVLFVKPSWIFIAEAEASGKYLTLKRCIYVESIRSNSVLSLASSKDIQVFHRVPDGMRVLTSEVVFSAPVGCDLSDILG